MSTLDNKFPGGGLNRGFTVVPNDWLDYAGELSISASELQFYLTIKRFYNDQLITDDQIAEKTGWSSAKIYRIRKQWEKAGCEIKVVYKKNEKGHLYCIGSKYDFTEIEAEIEYRIDKTIENKAKIIPINQEDRVAKMQGHVAKIYNGQAKMQGQVIE